MTLTLLAFEELERLRRLLETIRQAQVVSLSQYYHPSKGGFSHKLLEKKLSIASTATCVASLIAAHSWVKDAHPATKGAAPPLWAGTEVDLANLLLTKKEWKSGNLPENNVFTTAFVLECITDLDTVAPGKIATNRRRVARIEEAVAIIKDALKNGAAAIEGYPATAYVTQLAVRALLKRDALPRPIADRVRAWARHEITNQITLLTTKSKNADVFQLAYAAMLVAQTTEAFEMTPDNARLITVALEIVFDAQLPDGSWPRSRPLFHYPRVGSAYCYEYEMLVQLLHVFQERREPERLLPFLKNLQRAAEELPRTAFRLNSSAQGWSSGHHPQLLGPESWSTASVFHFAHELDRLVAEAIRQSIFDYLDIIYTPPIMPQTNPNAFAEGLLDSVLWEDSSTSVSLKKTIFEKFVNPLAQQVEEVRHGGQMGEDVPTSAIFFGPPGTSKTELSDKIARYIGWPRLTVDPSHIVRNGLDLVQTEANKLFSMLAVAEEIVVLLDEFDELVRDRGASAEMLSRFLTTAMLPKLATIRKRRKIVFIIATNHIETFDIAISRPGRFDLVLQVMPPTADEKLRKWSDVAKHLKNLNLTPDLVRKHIDDLTFDEFRISAPLLLGAASADEAYRTLESAYAKCTLKTQHVVKDDANRTWLDVSVEQRSRVRTG